MSSSANFIAFSGLASHFACCRYRPMPVHPPSAGALAAACAFSAERVAVPAPTPCTRCRSEKLSKNGVDVIETLETITRHWEVIHTTRKKFPCGYYEQISKPPAPRPPGQSIGRDQSRLPFIDNVSSQTRCNVFSW